MVDGGRLAQDLRVEFLALAADLCPQGRHEADRGSLLQAELAACSWLITTVLVRFSEDNHLIDAPFLAGHGARLALARDRQKAYFRRNPERTDRDWISEALGSLGTSSATLRMFDPLHTLMSRYPISHDAASRLVSFWRRTDHGGNLVFDFIDTDLDTGFLVDFYADVSEAARKEFVLVKTPDFVARLIVERTLVTALTEYGVTGLRGIDLACGSGTFPLLMFDRLLSAWRAAGPSAGTWTQVAGALASVHGIDKNPIAAVITRFRLLIAAMQAVGARRISEVPDLPIVIAVGDSLLPPGTAAEHGMAAAGGDIDKLAASSASLLANGSYDVVVGNPPNIAVRDAREQALYRDIYSATRGAFPLTMPFLERAFGLARSDCARAGRVGLILANSFAKREFGRAMVEDYLPTVELTHVLDTSGVFIPGHTTPTVILLGRARAPHEPVVRIAVGIRGEPSEPADGSGGVVWGALVDQVDQPGSASEWIQVKDVSRQELARHPWLLSASGANDLLDKLRAGAKLGTLTARIGYNATTGADDAFLAPAHVFRRCHAEPEATVTVLRGSHVRDWEVIPAESAFKPDGRGASFTGHLKRLWPQRTTLRSRRVFGGQSFAEAGRPWHAWHQVADMSGTHPWSIAYSRVATSPHFAILREGITALQSAPVIKLPSTASHSEHYGVAGTLNSSVASIYLKQYSQSKGAPSADQLRADEPWGHIYEFTGTRLADFPLPGRLPAERGQELDELTQELSRLRPTAGLILDVTTAADLAEMKADWHCVRARMIALQEELDWDMYHKYGLFTDNEAAQLVAPPEVVPGLALGERAFEIVMARRMAAGDLETQWFDRHGSTPVTGIPEHWPSEYKAMVARRIECIQKNRDIGLIERPEYKRRWYSESWDQVRDAALRDWLLDQCEARDLWFGANGTPQPMTINQLADRLRSDAGVVAVAQLIKGNTTDRGELADTLAQILADEHVPYLAQYRYKAEGLLKRAAWERTWDLQRKEDASGRVLDIPAPPVYRITDFVRSSYWRHRGKLDVPKERFISYPDASPGSDGSLLLGWAGWDHLERAQALRTLIEERRTVDGWGTARLTPLLAGLSELMPWVRQWHSEVAPVFGQSPVDVLDAYLAAQLGTHSLTDEALHSWMAPPVRRGRPPKNPRPGIQASGH